MKILPTLSACAVVLAYTAAPVFASDTIPVPKDFARKQEVEVEVTSMGLVINVGSPIRSVDLVPMSDVTFIGVDGVLCDAKAECPEAKSPTMLLLKKVPPIKFKNQLPSSDGTRMLYVTTEARNLYRFRVKPSSAAPPYTEVVIQSDMPASIPSSIMR